MAKKESFGYPLNGSMPNVGESIGPRGESRDMKVEIQRGPMEIDKPTYRWENYETRQSTRMDEIAGVKWGQTMEYHEPKK